MRYFSLRGMRSSKAGHAPVGRHDVRKMIESISKESMPQYVVSINLKTACGINLQAAGAERDSERERESKGESVFLKRAHYHLPSRRGGL